MLNTDFQSMKKSLVLLAVMSVAACSCGGKQSGAQAPGSAEASLSYRAAWEKAQRGDRAGSQADMKALADKYPKTAAGHRAQARVASAGQPPGMVAGVLMGVASAAGAIPGMLGALTTAGQGAGPQGVLTPEIEPPDDEPVLPAKPKRRR